MILRGDHVAAAAFVVFGIAILALSGDLPTGTLSFPGAGFLPKLVAALTIVLGIALFLRAGESPPFASIDWSDGKHAACVLAVTAAAVAAYEWLGFAVTTVLMLLVLLVAIERRNPVRAVVYSVGVTALTYWMFEYLLKTPLPAGPWGF